MRGLQLNISLGGTDRFAGMGSTYRDEGLSVGQDHMRFQGEEIEMEVTLSDLNLGRKIGQGACSTVNIATHVVTGEQYAVKIFNVYDSSQASQLFKEVSMLTRTQDCDALVSLKGAFHSEGNIGVIIEYMDRGSIEYMLRPEVDLTEKVLAATIYQIIWGLGYLHFDNRLHRDLKPGNILFNSQGQVKLADFGIAKELENSTAMSGTAVGTFKYMSPERLLGLRYDKSGDIWSIGIIILELWTKTYPFSHCCSTPIDLVSELENLTLERVINSLLYPPLMREVLFACLAKEPVKRATCSDLINAEWFSQFGLTGLENAQEVVAEWLWTLEGRAADSKNEGKSASPMSCSFGTRGSMGFKDESSPMDPMRRKSRGRSYAEDYNDNRASFTCASESKSRK
jgi:mitogen-activated protein kinase kinase 1